MTIIKQNPSNAEKSNTTILSIENLTKTYCSSHLGKKKFTPALRGVDINVFDNEIFALIGLNGSGKTTTMKILLGLITPSSGSFKIFQSSKITPEVKKNLGYLPEIPYFQKEFTPREILKFWGQLSDLSGNHLTIRIKEVLHYTSLDNAADNTIKEFSKGMLQRLGLAQALLSEPRLLILDEPMGGLDPKGIIDIRKLMLSLKENGKTIFFSSHIIAEVAKVADRVGIIHNGRILKIIKPHPKLEEEFLDTIDA